MTGDADRNPVSRREDVVRYAGQTKCDDGKIDGIGFLPRRDDNGELSVNRLAGLAETDVEAVARVRTLCHLKIGSSGLWGQFNIGDAIDRLRDIADLDGVHCLADPLPLDEGYPADPTHAVICPLPYDDGSEFADLVGDTLKNAVGNNHYPGRL